MDRRQFLAATGGASLVAAQKKRSVGERAACSSLAQRMQPLEVAAERIAGLGYRSVDVSCMNWAAHVDVQTLLTDFDKEADRVAGILADHRLGVSNLTFDAVDSWEAGFDAWIGGFASVAALGERLETTLVNLMAPAASFAWDEAVARLARAVEAAGARGVRVSVETHVDQMTERPADAVRLCREVPGLGLTLDPSHFFAGPNQGQPFDGAYALAYGTGIRAGGTRKDQLQVPWGEGPVDFQEVVGKLEDAGYTGYYVAEYLEDYSPEDPLVESEKVLAWLRRFPNG
jgi:sugar phosphate isomerase/epimerase